MINSFIFIQLNFQNIGLIEVDLNELVYNEKDAWTNYPKGLFKILHDASYLNLYFFGNIPNV